MFSLLHGLWEYRFKRTQYQVLLVGLDHAGKSTFLEQVKRLYRYTAHCWYFPRCCCFILLCCPDIARTLAIYVPHHIAI